MQYEVRKQVASYLAMKLLANHSTGRISYYLCLFMQTQFQLGSYIHACTTETFSRKSIRFNPYFGLFVLPLKGRGHDHFHNSLFGTNP